MVTKPDSFTPFDEALAAAGLSDPWVHGRDEAAAYQPDYGLLEQLLTIPIAANKGWATGALANGVDSWLAHELRRSGFTPDEVWPRATRPRILPRDVALLLEKLPRDLSNEVRAKVIAMPAIAPTDAKILGRAYEKQVDVAIARWDRGPELLLSTKTQVSSFGKNLSNRFEEAYGDAGNLRSRYPLAAVGFFFVQRSTILTQEPDAYERTVDMMRKLRDLGGANGYTATGLALVSWSEEDSTVKVELDRVPEDVRPEQFMTRMIEQVLAATSVSQHVDVRSLIERRELAVTEEDETTDLP
ncbi:hypothetical protein RR49_00040 [Microbacterium ginsengisoli]|jgi:hypothetical protein|uniref:Restriction endonuclease n=1 Tax=Microbacterium ginsengisoli TaxID=400772 RepID=A0A0F0M067_9MICO|nr:MULTISPECIES: hypothetical protein [Microbacterium]KJL45631.1 hypothetical protein RR49_00040 [Microbacterium ginsengisoli]MEA1265161.1 hypothetical protein [Microbacterium sp. STF-2]